MRYLSGLVARGERAAIHLNYDGVDLARAEFAPRLDPPETPGEFRILAVGRLVERKGWPFLFDAIRLLKERGYSPRLRVLGEGPLRRDLEKLAAAYGIEGEVNLMGAATHARVLRDMRRADCLVAPSIIARDGERDSVPGAVVEAMATGLPVIAGRVAGVPEFIVDGETGLLVGPGDGAGNRRRRGATSLADFRPCDDGRDGAGARREEFHCCEEHGDSAKIGSRAIHERYAVSKKKVLYIVDRLDADRPEAVVARIARGLDRERYEPFVCCLHKGGDLAEDLKAAGVPVFALHKRRTLDFGMLSLLRLKMRELRADVIHTYLFNANAWGRYAAHHECVPRVIASEHSVGTKSSKIRRLVDRVTVRWCDAVIAESEAVAEKLRAEIGVKPGKIRVVPGLGGDDEAFAAAVRRIEEIYDGA